MDTKNRILSFTFQLLPSRKYHQITDSKIQYSLRSILCMSVYMCMDF